MNNETTGKFITELRKQKNLTQAQLAEMIHVSDKAVSRWETGRGFPDLDNMEALSSCLDITVAELLKGERLSDSITKEEVQDITEGSFSISKELLNRKKYIGILLGFLVGLLIIGTAVIHMTSPIYISGAGDALTIEELQDGTVIAILGPKVSGYDTEDVREPESNEPLTFISCYTTRWSELTGKEGSSMVLIGNKSELGNIYYSPSSNGDELIYSGDKASEVNGGVQTLPRLAYNYWLIIGIVLSASGLIAFYVFRKRYFAGRILRIVLVPVAFTLSIPLCLMGRFDEIYNASFYFSGIVLTAAVIYFVIILLIRARTSKKASGI